MKWQISYDEADDWIYIRCKGTDVLKRVEGSSHDPAQLVRFAKRLDANPEFEFSEDAERFRGAILA